MFARSKYSRDDDHGASDASSSPVGAGLTHPDPADLDLDREPAAPDDGRTLLTDVSDVTDVTDTAVAGPAHADTAAPLAGQQSTGRRTPGQHLAADPASPAPDSPESVPGSEPASGSGSEPASGSAFGPPSERADPAKSLDDMLARLRTAAERSTSSAPVPDVVDEQAGMLRAARDAQQQAQEMLAMATQARSAASEQAEQLLHETQVAVRVLRAETERHAELVRTETAEWAADQRAQVQSVVAELIAEAQREAEQIRAQAVATAMAEAEVSAERYLAEAVARGTEDAEAIRNQARELLDRCRAVAGEASTSVQQFLNSTGAVVADLRHHVTGMEQLLAEVGAPRPSTPAAPTTAGTLAAAAPATEAEGFLGEPAGTPPTSAGPLGSLFRASEPDPTRTDSQES